ncbi:hypothetical protein Nepgr_013558 [Nepenthes gracilis]|uniref:Uncharacterized protein n=1 Tax=Nepenthes gracilis TaxID=150966 RepID=A0AAD3SJB9_NEPGR|nr:hypothetical protein Nepgr_013558 [Nepenthes gracilis]
MCLLRRVILSSIPCTLRSLAVLCMDPLSLLCLKHEILVFRWGGSWKQWYGAVLMYGLMDVWVLLAAPAWGASIQGALDVDGCRIVCDVVLSVAVTGVDWLVAELTELPEPFSGNVNSSFVLASCEAGSLFYINFGNWMALFRLKFSFLYMLDPLWRFFVKNSRMVHDAGSGILMLLWLTILLVASVNLLAPLDASGPSDDPIPLRLPRTLASANLLAPLDACGPPDVPIPRRQSNPVDAGDTLPVNQWMVQSVSADDVRKLDPVLKPPASDVGATSALGSVADAEFLVAASSSNAAEADRNVELNIAA